MARTHGPSRCPKNDDPSNALGRIRPARLAGGAVVLRGYREPGETLFGLEGILDRLRAGNRNLSCERDTLVVVKGGW
jgi:hypothetical protein